MWIVSLARMVKMTLAKISLLLLISSLALAQEVRRLHFNFNDNVTIWISNEFCADARYKNIYPWRAQAVRKDGEVLQGCFNGEANTVTIQWIGGDISKFPANVFLINKDAP